MIQSETTLKELPAIKITPPDQPIPSQPMQTADMQGLSATSAQGLLRDLHTFAHGERIALNLPLDRETAKHAVQAGQNIVRALEENPLHDGETTGAKLARYEYIMDQLIDPQTREFSTQLYQKLLPVFQKHGITDPALILLGSNVTGGMSIRALSGTLGTERDLDMAFTSTSLGDKDFKGLQVEIDSTVNTLQEGRDTRFVTDPMLNVENFHRVTFTKDTVGSELDKPLPMTDEYGATEVTNCFFPSIPPEINMQQRQVILDQLRDLAARDSDLWQFQVDSILETWDAIEFVKTKHFTPGHEEYGAELSNPSKQPVLDTILERAQQIKRQLLADLLYSTESAAQ